MKSSVNGNPRFRAYCGGFSFVTAPDSSLAYEVQNFAGRPCKVTIGTHFGRATLNSIEPWDGETHTHA